MLLLCTFLTLSVLKSYDKKFTCFLSRKYDVDDITTCSSCKTNATVTAQNFSSKKCLKIPERKSEAVNRRSDDIITKRKRRKDK